jgi:hypothetical protein
MNLAPDVVTVAVSRVDGGVTIMRVIKTSYRKPSEEEMAAGIADKVVRREVDVTPEYIELQIKRHVEGGNWIGDFAPTTWRIVPNDYLDDTNLPDYRNAWKDTGKGKPEHDMVKAKEIHRARLRKIRGNYLDALDADYMRADEAGDNQTKKAVAAKKQKFRDVTEHPAIEAAQTVEELKACTLEALTNG